MSPIADIRLAIFLTYLNAGPRPGSEISVLNGLGDPFLNYFALGLLVFVVVVIFYGIIAIHDIPARIADARLIPRRHFPRSELGQSAWTKSGH